MKSFLMNNTNNSASGQHKKTTPGPSSMKAVEFDRASQRSIVESTNAYIRAAQ